MTVNGYLTVEAAMVFPIVLAVQLLTIYLFVFRYDRCLLEQDMARLVVLGCGAEETDKNELSVFLRKRADELYMEKYVAWEIEEIKIELEKNQVCVDGRGRLRFPGAEWGEVNAVCESEKRNPALFIRQCRKLKGEK